jgi:hypothetical protein
VAGVIDPGTGRIGKDGTSVWLSFLATGAGADLVHHWVGLSLCDGSNAQGVAERLFLGKPAGGVNEVNWGVLYFAGPEWLSDVPVSQPAFFVVRIDFKLGSDELV